MKRGKILSDTSDGYKWKFQIEFSQSTLGPYSFLFQRENLYFNEDLGERGSYFFPLKDTRFKNTEIFLETNDIVIWIGERWSFSGKARRFVEIVNLATKNSYRFYPEEVSLIYNAHNQVIIYYKKSDHYKKLSLDLKTLEKISEHSVYMSAFFKLLYNHTIGEYARLIFKPKGRSTTLGHFIEEPIANEKTITKDIPWLNMAYLDEPDGQMSSPESFNRENFMLKTVEYEKIDVWEASLTWIL